MAKSKKKLWLESHKRALVLSSNYEVLNFVPEVRAVLMLLKDRVEVISEWEATLHTSSVKIKIPSIVRLKNPIKKKKAGPVRYHRTVVFRRDEYRCQYCGRKLGKRDATIDHVLPVSQGGKTTYKNCVTACGGCNHKKAFKTPDEAGMALLKKPELPNILHLYNVDADRLWHPAWDTYLGYLVNPA